MADRRWALSQFAISPVSREQATEIRGKAAPYPARMPLVSLRAYGRIVGVEAPDEVLQAVRERLHSQFRDSDARPERTWRVFTTAGRSWLLIEGTTRIGEFRSASGAVESLLSHLELWVAEHARRFVFVHAGCAVINGRAIVVPGRSMSGKSSLTAALIRSGATYFSDEYAVLDALGRVRPYPRKLSIRSSNGAERMRISAADLGGVTGRGTASVGLVAHLRFDAVGGWRTNEVSRGTAILALLDNAVPARSRPQAVLTALERLTANAVCISGTRGDADEAVHRLIDILAAAGR